MNRKFLAIPFGLFGMSALTAYAQQAHLPEIFVTAARSEQALETVNASVEVVSAEKIRTFAGRSLSEVLQHATGVQIKDTGSSSTFSMRGQDSDKTLVLVDGLRRTEKYAGANLNNIQLEDVERIEIVRGPMSALYGSDALGGVINIITRGPRKGSETGVRFMAGQTGDGQRDTAILGGYGNWGNGQIGHRISFEAKRRDPYRLPSTDPRITDLNRERRDFLSYRGDIKAPAGRFDWGVELARQDDTGTGLTRTNTTYTRIENEARDFVQGGYRGRIGDGEFSVRMGYGQSDARVNRGTAQDELTLLKQTQLESQYAFEPMANHFAVIGYAYRQDDADISTNSKPVVRTVNALFAQDIWYLRPDVEMTLGVRYDSYNDFGNKITPRIAIAWRPDRWTLRAGLGKGFKAPSLLNLYMSSIIRGRYDLRGNPNLQPEESTSGELAAAYRLDRGNIEIVAHRSNVTNLIASVPTGVTYAGPCTGGTCSIQEYQNIGKAIIKGVEFSGNYQLTEFWTLGGSLEYLDAMNAITDTRLTDRPTWAAKLSLQWRHGRWQTDLRLRHVRDWYAADPTVTSSIPFDSDYTVASVRVAYALNQKTELFGGIDNLGNRLMPVNQAFRGTPDDPGSRFFYAGINARF